MSQNVYVFPGQGSQKVGMLKELHERFERVRETFSEASDTLDCSMAKLCFEDPDAQLGLTEYTQPALLTCSTAIWRLLLSQEKIPADPLVAGHSLGEYSALVALEVLPFADALRLVRLRGRAMQEAVPVGVGAMAAIMTSEADSLEKLCQQVSHVEAGEVVSIANENSPTQTVVSGHKAAVDRLIAGVKELKLGRAVPLPVSAPFHSPLMRPAAERMAKALEEVDFLPGFGRICANVDAGIRAAHTYTQELLVRQIEGRVRWVHSLEAMLKAAQGNMEAGGPVTFVEVGPGQVLQGLVKKTLGEHALAQGTDTLDQLKILLSQ